MMKCGIYISRQMLSHRIAHNCSEYQFAVFVGLSSVTADAGMA